MPDGPVEQLHEDEELDEPVAQGDEFGVVRVGARRRRPPRLLGLEDGDDRVALADLPLGDDPPEPLPVVADGEVRRARRTAPPDPPGLRPPAGRCPTIRPRRGPGWPPGATGRALRGPRARSAVPGGPSGRPGRGRSPGSRPRRRPSRPTPRRVPGGSASAVAGPVPGRVVTVVGKLRLDSSEFCVHNLLYESSTSKDGRGRTGVSWRRVAVERVLIGLLTVIAIGAAGRSEEPT